MAKIAEKSKQHFTENDIAKILDELEKMYPDADCELNFENLFQLIVAVVLSAQTTDKSVNKVTPALFAKYPDAQTMAQAGYTEAQERGITAAVSAEELFELGAEAISQMIHSIGMYRNKSRNILKLAIALTENYGGNVPEDYEKLIALPGVGRKTANVVLAEGFGHQRIAVDTHVFRVANRIGLTDEKDVLATENELMRVLPENRWSRTHHSLIFHGRYCCAARKPACEKCTISTYCRYFNSENISPD
ncbi:MAG: endonuclease III [Firmicutes bacterium]|nr:endonuclease III [Bacillota bacterium]